jgi:phosphoribosylaminoimidazole (AIR) synthetase
MADTDLTYAEAGVDIDVGSRMVGLIKRFLRSAARAGSGTAVAYRRRLGVYW